MRKNSILLVLSTVICTVALPVAVGEKIQPTSHVAATVGQLPNEQPTGQPIGQTIVQTTVTFSQQPARVGDRVAQTVGVQLQVNTSIVQAGQQAHAGKNMMQRRQQRFVEVVEVDQGRVRRAHVSFPYSRITNSENDEPETEATQPVEQKSYFVTRAGEQLLVTDKDGAIPTQAEFELVVTGLQHLGQPNPLIGHLVGKTFSIGDKLQLPKEIAEQMMGMGGQLGRVEEFSLALKSIRELDGQPCAVFASSIKAVGEPTNPIRVHAFGQVIIQAETCRTVSAEISGPLTLSMVENTSQGDFQYQANGSMRLSAKSKYGYAQQ